MAIVPLFLDMGKLFANGTLIFRMMF